MPSARQNIAEQFFELMDNETVSWRNAVLYQPYEEIQILIAENASCLAVKAFLRMCRLEFTVKCCANAEFMSPGGRITKLPFIQVGRFVVPEFEHIVAFVEGKGISLSSHLDADERSDLRARLSLVENIFSHAEIYISWMDKNVLNQITLPRNGSVYPWPLNAIQNWKKKRHYLQFLDVFGLKNKPIKKIVADVEKCCEILCELLGDNEYFGGNSPTELDALVFGHLFTIITTQLPNNILMDTVTQFELLVKFCKRIDSRYFQRT